MGPIHAIFFLSYLEVNLFGGEHWLPKPCDVNLPSITVTFSYILYIHTVNEDHTTVCTKFHKPVCHDTCTCTCMCVCVRVVPLVHLAWLSVRQYSNQEGSSLIIQLLLAVISLFIICLLRTYLQCYWREAWMRCICVRDSFSSMACSGKSSEIFQTCQLLGWNKNLHTHMLVSWRSLVTLAVDVMWWCM